MKTFQHKINIFKKNQQKTVFFSSKLKDVIKLNPEQLYDIQFRLTLFKTPFLMYRFSSIYIYI